ncbi:MAG TPA: tryptophanase [Bacteroidales bacterium]|jgi:tryptophanase|nr:tryptophanase [Bacteroidales bacterium]HQJ83270.1 tryptophanase [Bacteroidales bacterium]
MKLPLFEPYKIKMTEPVYTSSREEREKWIRDASFNVFNLKSEQVTIDLVSDTGSGAMSDRQWSALFTGDESYAGTSSFDNLRQAIYDITGFQRIIPTYQGRIADSILFSAMLKEGDIVPCNSLFDTSRALIEYRKAIPVDCTIRESNDLYAYHPFKGNLDLGRLDDILSNNSRERIPCIILSVTNNSTGGQPVSMENIRNIRELSYKYGVKLILNSSRFAENAWFIKTREAGYADKSIREILLEMFSHADAMTMSAQEDAISNTGGFTAFRDETLYHEAVRFNMVHEGLIHTGGMSGRDMNALARGLYEGTNTDFIRSRINQTAFLGSKLKEYGIPVVEPFGGHAIFIDVDRFLPLVPKEEFPAQVLVCEIFIEGGVRGSEVGTLLADRNPLTRENRYPANEFVRLAIPRRVYTDNHMSYVAAVVKNVFNRKGAINKGYRIIKEEPILRYFTLELEVA